ncbi:MAG: Mammalian cell entry protein [Chitinophagaceae bacterium]|nr:Mammalian cell entry protein [Chitinophagaceae bacterium]
MKINNETKVGVLAVVALTLLIIGFNFLKGKNIFSHSSNIYAVFTDLGTLEKSNQVKINGLSIGTVYTLTQKDKDLSGIVVTINLTRDVNIPKNSVAYISAGLIGASTLIIEKGNSTEYLKEGDTLITRMDNGFFGDVKSQLSPALIKVKDAIDSLKIVLGGINRVLDPSAKNNIGQLLSNLKDASVSLKSILNDKNGALATTLTNASSVTGNLKKNNDSITLLIGNANRLARKFGDLELAPTVDSLQGALSELKRTMAKFSSPNGSLGALMNDKQLYNKLTNTISSAEILLDDIRVHPKRYVNISVFGKKDKSGPLNSPTTKDSLSAGAH